MTQSAPISGTAYPRISIVGAGIAGLSLACRLQELKIPFSIYESRTLDTIGHNYAITLHRRSWKPLVGCLRSPLLSTAPFRQATAVDRLVEGQGRVTDSTALRSATFQGVDKDVRRWLVQRLSERGTQVNWSHKLTGISRAAEGKGAELRFEDTPASTTDIIIDAGGLRSPALDCNAEAAPKPRLLPYATYYGTRRIPGTEFSENFAKFFRTGNTIELVPETQDVPYIYLQKVHLPDPSSNSEDSSKHIVELRWVFSRPPRSGSDPLYRPFRKPEEAKDIPPEFYQEFVSSVKQHFSGNKKHMLTHFFNLESLHNDRILNWHLRLRLPTHDYLRSNTDRGGYKVIAIGDAAHGLPIVRSSGAKIAMNDAKHLSRWLCRLDSSVSSTDSDHERDFYEESGIFSVWCKEAQRAVQSLRVAHGQNTLSAAELAEVIGFSVNVDHNTTESSEEEETSSIDENLEQTKGHL